MDPVTNPDPRPLIAHVVYSFTVGGLENGIANLINRLPAERYRHAVIALAGISEEFRARVRRGDVEYLALNKLPGHAVRLYPRLFAWFRSRRPAIVHTRNLAALEAVVPARLAGVPVCIHGEHGWDVSDPHGTSAKYRWMRRLYRPFVTRYVALSKHTEDYLRDRVGIPSARLTRICNGVDAGRFSPSSSGRTAVSGCPFAGDSLWIAGTVGRMDPVKDQAALARAFALALEMRPEVRERLRLVMVGGGPLLDDVRRLVRDLGVAELAWLPGERSDVPEVLRGLDCFVLPSLAEGISNTILEAMACALPVIATRVGGNPELVEDGRSGTLVPAGDPRALARALLAYCESPDLAKNAGKRGRALVEERFSLDTMVSAYDRLYRGTTSI